ncbi:MAG TPA: tRNA (guanosine(37)-N1)-methyltransferase TrmD [Fimbriimonadaceae bacterium]|nr:tRNA (guanosine(37)-N1)-methyltransferase TrmD [Fimbriimonadaceae bacterium]HRJ97902.1 tRNA (guanosine(37)-N1)-methyltransferase TrmD [Fimbriimonadaceae bacterium]
MRIDFVTLFPEMVLPALRHSILARAEQTGIVSFAATNPRDFATDAHRTVDGRPCGGGPGMVMRPDVVGRALESLDLMPGHRIVLTDPNGERFEQRHARDIASVDHLVILCGHYEGIDDRIRQRYASDVFSIGDFVLTGGEFPALLIADAVVRLLPGVLGDPDSLGADSHSDGLLSYPQFTLPREWEGFQVPAVLLSGDHGAIARWRRRHALISTRRQRPDLFCRARLSKSDVDLLQ